MEAVALYGRKVYSPGMLVLLVTSTFFRIVITSVVNQSNKKGTGTELATPLTIKLVMTLF